MSSWLKKIKLGAQRNEQNEKILDLDQYNGRVNIMQPPNQNLKFQMMEKEYGEKNQ